MIVLIIANNVDPEEMKHNATFHLGLHCLPNTYLRVSNIKRVNEIDIDKIIDSESII